MECPKFYYVISRKSYLRAFLRACKDMCDPRMSVPVLFLEAFTLCYDI